MNTVWTPQTNVRFELVPSTYREIEEAYPGKLLAASFNALKRRDELDCDDVGLLTRMVDAMICKVAL